MTPAQYNEALRLHTAGLKLCELYPDSKRPVGDGWNTHAVASVRQDAGGYGLMLAMNGMCSVDVDSEDLCRAGLERCGFDLEKIRGLGVHTSSTRPGSGGRVTFKVPVASSLRWLKFSSKTHGTILELRAESPNLQDTLPGTVYSSADGSGPWVQDYDDGCLWTLDCAPELPDDLLAWWQRMSTDVDYLREQQALLVGQDVQLAISSGGGSLAFTSPYRVPYNSEHRVTEILERHDYTKARSGRYAPKTATGAAAVRAIPGRDDLWQSDHASDPLFGTFDAWTAHVVLDCGGDLLRAELDAELSREIAAIDGFDEEELVPLKRVERIERLEGPGGATRVEQEQVELPLPAFERERSGKIAATINNLIAALRRPDVCGMQIGMDTFRDEIMRRTPGGNDWRAFTDADYVWLRSHLESGSAGFKPIAQAMIRDVVLAIADENKFDSAIIWLESLQHDGTARCETFLSDHFGVADTPYHRAVSLYMWTAMAGRVLDPGCKCDMVPILVGEQGVGKSSMVSALVPSPRLMVEVSFNEAEDNLARKMRGKLVGEIAELKGLNSRDAESIKAFITRTHEKWIPKYREFETEYPRRLLFIGTTNEEAFLADPSGARRYLPVRVGTIDVGSIRSIVELCWAEAAVLFAKQGIAWRQAERLARQEHDEFRIVDAWEEPIKQWLNDPLFGEEGDNRREFVSTSEILTGAVGLDPKHISRREEMRAGNVLRNLGYVRRKTRIGTVTKWVYVPTCSLSIL
jgi:hypothetical protein